MVPPVRAKRLALGFCHWRPPPGSLGGGLPQGRVTARSFFFSLARRLCALCKSTMPDKPSRRTALMGAASAAAGARLPAMPSPLPMPTEACRRCPSRCGGIRSKRRCTGPPDGRGKPVKAQSIADRWEASDAVSAGYWEVRRSRRALGRKAERGSGPCATLITLPAWSAATPNAGGTHTHNISAAPTGELYAARKTTAR